MIGEFYIDCRIYMLLIDDFFRIETSRWTHATPGVLHDPFFSKFETVEEALNWGYDITIDNKFYKLLEPSPPLQYDVDLIPVPPEFVPLTKDELPHKRGINSSKETIYDPNTVSPAHREKFKKLVRQAISRAESILTQRAELIRGTYSILKAELMGKGLEGKELVEVLTRRESQYRIYGIAPYPSVPLTNTVLMTWYRFYMGRLGDITLPAPAIDKKPIEYHSPRKTPIRPRNEQIVETPLSAITSKPDSPGGLLLSQFVTAASGPLPSFAQPSPVHKLIDLTGDAEDAELWEGFGSFFPLHFLRIFY